MFFSKNILYIKNNVMFILKNKTRRCGIGKDLRFICEEIIVKARNKKLYLNICLIRKLLVIIRGLSIY